jgi:hypothetical protein
MLLHIIMDIFPMKRIDIMMIYVKLMQRPPRIHGRGPCPINHMIDGWTYMGKPTTCTFSVSIPCFLFCTHWHWGLCSFYHLNCWCWRIILMVSPEHKMMASAIARVWAVCVLRVSPLEEPIPDSVSDFLQTIRCRRRLIRDRLTNFAMKCSSCNWGQLFCCLCLFRCVYLVTKTWRVVRVPSILSLALAMSKTRVDEQTILPWRRETPHGIKHLVPEPCIMIHA